MSIQCNIKPCWDAPWVTLGAGSSRTRLVWCSAHAHLPCWEAGPHKQQDIGVQAACCANGAVLLGYLSLGHCIRIIGKVPFDAVQVTYTIMRSSNINHVTFCWQHFVSLGCTDPQLVREEFLQLVSARTKTSHCLFASGPNAKCTSLTFIFHTKNTVGLIQGNAYVQYAECTCLTLIFHTKSTVGFS